jgi:hypothetical protein
MQKPTLNEIKTARVTKVVKEFGETTIYKYVIRKGDTEIKVQSPDKFDLVYNDELDIKLIKINQSLNTFKED